MRLAFAAALCALLAGCGSDRSGQPAAPADDDASASATPVDARSGEEAELAKVAEAYLVALAGKDWSAACATRSHAERAELERLAGTCERAFEVIAENEPGVTKLVAGAHAGEVRIRGAVAGVDVVHPGQTKPAMTLSAVKRDGVWLLENVEESKIP